MRCVIRSPSCSSKDRSTAVPFGDGAVVLGPSSESMLLGIDMGRDESGRRRLQVEHGGLLQVGGGKVLLGEDGVEGSGELSGSVWDQV